MNVILIILLVLGIIIAFLLFLALVTKNEYTIAREIIIDLPRQQVFDYVKLIRNQEEYSHWVMQDPTNRIRYVGTDGQIGFLSKWEGEKQAGKGEQEIIDIQEGESIRLEVRFERPFKNVAYTEMVTQDKGDGKTLVLWKMYGRNKFPMILFNLVADSMLGKDMEKSLGNLKQNIEARG